MFGRLITQSSTLGEAITTVQRIVASHNSGATYWLTREGDEARLSRRFGIGERAFRQADLMTVALMIQLIRMVAGPQWQPDEIDMQSVERDDGPTLAAFPGARLRFGRPATSIVFPSVLLVRSLAPPRASAPVIAPAQERAWTSAAPPRDFLMSLTTLIESLLASGRCDVVSTAAAAGMSVRTFQRTLAESGTSFSSVLQRTRLAMADRMLADPNVKIIDVAYELGYGDPAHFTRAFRQWTSLSPNEYRRLRLREMELPAAS